MLLSINNSRGCIKTANIDNAASLAMIRTVGEAVRAPTTFRGGAGVRSGWIQSVKEGGYLRLGRRVGSMAGVNK